MDTTFQDWLAKNHPEALDESWRSMLGAGALMAGSMLGGNQPTAQAAPPVKAQVNFSKVVQQTAPDEFTIIANVPTKHLMDEEGRFSKQLAAQGLKNDAVKRLSKFLRTRDIPITNIQIVNMQDNGDHTFGYVKVKINKVAGPAAAGGGDRNKDGIPDGPAYQRNYPRR